MRSILPPKFIPYCESQGIKILPDDIRFIEKQLRRWPSERHRSILSDYLKEFELGSRVDGSDAVRCNRGRFVANCWLRGL
jgi:hypothetical protein